MDDRMRAQRLIIHRRIGISSSLNVQEKISRQNLSSIPSIREAPHRHQSLQNKSRHPSIKEIDSNNIVHVLIRPSTNFKQVSHDLSYGHNSSKVETTDHTKSIPATKYTIETISITQRSDNASRYQTKENNISYSYQRNLGSDRKKNFKRKKKYPGGYCCSCQPLCTFFSLIAALLLASGIAALLLAFIKPSGTSTASTITTTTSLTSTSTSSTTSTSTSTTTTSTSTTTTTVTRLFTTITRAGDPIIGLYNTSAGQSTGASNGIYSGPAEYPSKAIDGSVNTKYLNFGFQGYVNAPLNQPGFGTGFYVTPSISNASVATGLLFATANDYPNRDPIRVTLEGSNATTSATLNLGSSWTLIYSGPTGIDPITAPPRQTYVPQQNFSNTMAFRSYRLLITSQPNTTADAVQYSESQILGYA